MTTGPMQLMFVGFEGDVLESSVFVEIIAASYYPGIRLIDLLVVEKDESGDVYAADLGVQTEDDEIQYGALLGDLLELGGGEDEVVDAITYDKAAAAARSGDVLGITPYDVNDLVYSMPEGHSGIVALFELNWARELRETANASGGTMLGQALIQPEALEVFGEKLQAALKTATQVEALQEAEIEKVLQEIEANDQT